MKTDSEIQKDVIDELEWEPLVDANAIGVGVKKGVVTLSGSVDSYLMKSRIEDAAKRVAGVKAVAEDIEVKFGPGLVKSDTEIAAAILNALKWSSAIDEEKVKVKVEDGVVTLDGEVDWNFQRLSIAEEVQNLLGVKRIVNNIRIKAVPLSKDLKDKISSAFRRSASVDADKVKVSVSGSKVILSGTVRSWAEKKDAENAAWGALGVTGVENDLEIQSPVYAF